MGIEAGAGEELAPRAGLRAEVVVFYVTAAAVLGLVVARALHLLHLLAVSTNRGDGPDDGQLRNAHLGVIAIGVAVAGIVALAGVTARWLRQRAWPWFSVAVLLAVVSVGAGSIVEPYDLRIFGSECRHRETYEECH